MAGESRNPGMTQPPTTAPATADGTAPQGTTAGLFSGHFIWLVLGLVAYMVAAGFEVVAVSVIMPTVATELNAMSSYSFPVSITVACAIVGTLLAGPWADQKGPRGPIMVGAGCMVAGLLVAGFAHSMTVFLVGRAIQGVGIGLVNVSSYVIVGRELPAHLHARVFSLTAIAWILPAMVGPLVAGVLVDTIGWRWAFWGVAPIFVVAAIIILAAMRSTGGAAEENLTAREWRSRLIRALIIAAGIAALQPAGDLVQEGKLVLVVVAVIIIMAVLIAAARKLVPPRTLTLGEGLPSLVASRLFLAGCYFAMESYIPLMGQSFRGLTPTQSGLLVASGSITWGIASFLQARLPQHWNRTKVLTFGMACGTLGTLTTLTLTALDIPIAVAIMGWGIAGFGVGIAYPLANVMVLALSQPGEIGNNSSSLSLAEQLGTSTSLALGGVLFGALVGGSMLYATLAFTLVPFLYSIMGVIAAAHTKVGALAGQVPAGGTPTETRHSSRTE